MVSVVSLQQVLVGNPYCPLGLAEQLAGTVVCLGDSVSLGYVPGCLCSKVPARSRWHISVVEHDWNGRCDGQDVQHSRDVHHIPFKDKHCLIGTAYPLLPIKSSQIAFWVS